jgi:DNA processing protein
MPERAETIRHWLALIRAPQVGPATFYSLLQSFVEPEAVFKAPQATLENLGLRPETIAYLREPDWHRIDADLAWLETPGSQLLLLNDSLYPPLLKDIPDPPPVLFVLGDATILGHKQLAMVGSRNPTPAGL